jgi:subtilase family serine protease
LLASLPRSIFRTRVLGPLTAICLLAGIAPGASGAVAPQASLDKALAGARALLPSTVADYIGSVPALGPAAPSAPARALIALQHRDQVGLLRLISAVSTPGNKLYEHYLTPAQFVSRYAPSETTVAAVEAFARSFGLHVASVPSNRAYVYVTGTVAEMDRAFKTTIDRYELGGATVQAPRLAASVPARLAKAITGVEGLDTADVAQPLGLAATPPAPAYVNADPMSSYWGQSLATQAPGAFGQKALPNVIAGYTPQQLEGAYGVSSVIAHGLNGAGQTVAVIDAYSSPTIVSDVDTWSKDHALPAPKLTVDDNAAERDQPEGPTVPTDVPVLGGANLQNPQDWFGEETLDVEAVHAMAPGASIVMQGALSDENVDLERAQNQVVSKDEAQIISNSYGGTTDSTNTTSDGYWQEAAAQGIGVYFSSGDDGDQTSGGADPADRAVDSGANSPYVTAVGGTTLAVGAHDNYEFETYWGSDSATLTNGAWGASSYLYGGGGGTSEVYSEPSYQSPVVPSRFSDYWQGNANEQSGATIPGRVVPDVAMDGDPNAGFLLGITEDFSAYNNPDGYDLPGDTDEFGQYRIGGTSLASPLFAGVMALADQAAGKPHGFANPALYALYKTKAFHDITAPKSTVAVVRTNYVNNTNSSGGIQTLMRTTGVTGTLSSIPGYDDSTGLGSPNGLPFLSGLAPHSALIARLAR